MMAARLRKTHQDDVRTKIKVSNLITRVQKYADGELTDEDISPNRLNAIKLLLAKALPDLSSITIEGGESPLQVEHSKRPKLTPEQWLEAHGIKK